MVVYACTQDGHAQSSWRATNNGVRFCQRFKALMGIAFGGLTCLSHRQMGIDCPDQVLSDLRSPKCSVASMSGGGRAKRRRKAIRGDGGDDGAEGYIGEMAEEGDRAIRGIRGRVGGVGECWEEQWRRCKRTPTRKSAKG